jgi:DNA-binding LacI/PurR family transcriptional regulator
MGGDRPTVGVLVDWLKDSYQNTVVAGLRDAARARDVDLMVFAGGVLGAPSSNGAHRNFVFDLCSPGNLDGIVVLAGALANHLGPAAVEALVGRAAPIPVASVALALPHIPSLLLDEAPGMRQALEHIVVRHGCRRVAFIRGPAVNAEAERRYALYRSVMAEHDLTWDEALICDGNFQESSGRAAIGTLLDERKVDFDAVVAANDYMALGAISALGERGVHVPSDVAVIGFDDIEDARFATPPLTTVRQPLYQQGVAALDLVLAQLEGRQVATETLMATELVMRQSCGCFSGLARPGRAGPVTPTETSIESLLAEHAADLRGQMMQAVHGAGAALPPDWCDRLIGALGAELGSTGGNGLFAATMEGLLAEVVAAGDDVAAWQGLVTALRRLLLPALANQPMRCVQAEDLWHQARILIADFAERAQAQHRLHDERLTRALSESGAALLAQQDLPSLVAAAADELPRLGVPGAWVVLFERESGSDAGPARLVLAHDESAENAESVENPENAESAESAESAAAPAPAGTMFAAGELMPAWAHPAGRRLLAVVEPLFVHDRPLGFMILEMGPREGIVFAALGEQMSAALANVRTMERVRS